MIAAIAWRELRSLFLSPLAWVILAVLQILLALLFLLVVDNFAASQTQLLSMDNAPGLTEVVVGQLFSNAAVILLLITPLITMRLVSDERRNRTLTLLFTAPIGMTQIVLGKYLAALLFLLIVVVQIALMPLSLLVGANLDWGLFGASLLGLSLLLASFAAIGLFMSTLTQSPTVAAISTFGLLLFLWILEWAAEGSPMRELLSYLSITGHYQAFMRGVFDSADALYYVLVIAAFLVLSVRRLDADRLGG